MSTSPNPITLKIDPNSLSALDPILHPGITGQFNPPPDQTNPVTHPLRTDQQMPAQPIVKMPQAAAPASAGPAGAAGGAPGAPTQAAGPATPAAPRAMSTPQQAHLNEYNRLVGSPSGLAGLGQNLHGAPKALATIGKIPLQVGDAILRGFFPAVEQGIPGTEGHHAALVNAARGAVNEDIAQRKEEAGEEAERGRTALEGAQGEETRARIPLIGAQTDEAKARAENLLHPPGQVKEEQILYDKAGNAVGYRDAQGKYYGKDDPGLPEGVKAVIQGSKAPQKEGETPLGEDRIGQLNKMLTKRDPAYALPANATQKDFDRVSKLMENDLKDAEIKETHARNEQDRQQAHQDAVELRKMTMAMTQQNREHGEEHQVQTAAFKAYSPALDSAERFNVMAENYEKAVKDHDQQAMLSLLANHLGMTMGLQKGARMTRDIIREAQASRPWLQGMEAKFDKDGYLSGVTLTPPQMRQMVDLGRSRFMEDLKKGASEARFQGYQGEGPDRAPNPATVNYYIAQAGGDPAKAKALAKADGWTVQ